MPMLLTMIEGLYQTMFIVAIPMQTTLVKIRQDLTKHKHLANVNGLRDDKGLVSNYVYSEFYFPDPWT